VKNQGRDVFKRFSGQVPARVNSLTREAGKILIPRIIFKKYKEKDGHVFLVPWRLVNLIRNLFEIILI
jgi:hypothetical protein